MKDLAGQRFGRLVAIEPIDKRRGGLVVWRCRCDCGNECEVVGAHLTKGATRSCGCLRRDVKRIDLTGQKFGCLTAVRPTDKRIRGSVVWECSCDCGNSCEEPAAALRAGQVRSCGCLRSSRRPARGIAGKRFGKLTAVEPAGRRDHGSVVWRCVCECGEICEVPRRLLTSGAVTSCGC